MRRGSQPRSLPGGRSGQLKERVARNGRLGWRLAALLAATPVALGAQVVDSSYLQLVEWRSAGPTRGGRVVAAAEDPVNTLVFYQGSTGGGVWKTEDGGISWRNVSDGYFHTGSVGAIGLAASNPQIVYVGMGESCIRGNASIGDGVYQSTDGGKTWQHVGLEATSQIARVRVHPTNPNLVYVAALGSPWGRARTGASTVRGTADARGRRSGIGTRIRARSTSSWTRATPT